MKCFVTIDSGLINKEDIVTLNAQSKEIQYVFIEGNSFFPSEVILILIDLVQNIGYDAAYDTLKYILLKVVSLLVNKRGSNANLQFEISCNNKRFSLKGKNALTEQQMDKLVDAAVKALLSEWSYKENSNEKQ